MAAPASSAPAGSGRGDAQQSVFLLELFLQPRRYLPAALSLISYCSEQCRRVLLQPLGWERWKIGRKGADCPCPHHPAVLPSPRCWRRLLARAGFGRPRSDCKERFMAAQSTPRHRLGAGKTIPISYPQARSDPICSCGRWAGRAVPPQLSHTDVLGSLGCDQRAQRPKLCFSGSCVALPCGKPPVPEGIPSGFSPQQQESSGNSSVCVGMMLRHHIGISACKGPGDSDPLPFGNPPAIPVISSPLYPKHLPVLNFHHPKSPFPAHCCCCLGRNFSFVRSGAALSGSICRRLLLESDSKC